MSPGRRVFVKGLAGVRRAQPLRVQSRAPGAPDAPPAGGPGGSPRRPRACRAVQAKWNMYASACSRIPALCLRRVRGAPALCVCGWLLSCGRRKPDNNIWLRCCAYVVCSCKTDQLCHHSGQKPLQRSSNALQSSPCIVVPCSSQVNHMGTKTQQDVRSLTLPRHLPKQPQQVDNVHAHGVCPRCQDICHARDNYQASLLSA